MFRSVLLLLLKSARTGSVVPVRKPQTYYCHLAVRKFSNVPDSTGGGGGGGDELQFGDCSRTFSSRMSFRKSSPEQRDAKYSEPEVEQDEPDNFRSRPKRRRRNTPYWYLLQCRKLLKREKVRERQINIIILIINIIIIILTGRVSGTADLSVCLWISICHRIYLSVYPFTVILSLFLSHSSLHPSIHFSLCPSFPLHHSLPLSSIIVPFPLHASLIPLSFSLILTTIFLFKHLSVQHLSHRSRPHSLFFSSFS